MARIVKREGPLVVALRTEGAVIIPKVIREQLGLRAGDLLEVEIRGGDLVLRPIQIRRLMLQGVKAASLDKLTGLVRLGGNAVKDKKRFYER